MSLRGSVDGGPCRGSAWGQAISAALAAAVGFDAVGACFRRRSRLIAHFQKGLDIVRALLRCGDLALSLGPPQGIGEVAGCGEAVVAADLLRADVREDEDVVITETGGLRAQTHVFDRFRRSWVAGELGSPPIGTTLPTPCTAAPPTDDNSRAKASSL